MNELITSINDVIFLFAFSRIIGNYYYGEANIRFIAHSNTAVSCLR